MIPAVSLRPRTFFALAALLACVFFALPAHADSLVVTPVAEGVTLKSYKYDRLYGSKMEVFVAVVDLNNPTIGVKFNYRRGKNNGDPYRPVSVLAAEIPRAVAAINAQFFDTAGGGSVQYQKIDGILINGPDSPNDRQGVIVHADGRVEIVWRPGIGWSSLTDVPNILPSNDDLITNGAVRNVYPTGSHHTSRHPRTAAAWTYDNKLLLIVVDGRSLRSAGMTMQEWANYIATLGNIRHAFNYDGGGSSTLWANGVVRNTSSDPTPRAVANALVVTSDPLPSPDIIVDNPQARVVGAWQTGTTAGDRYGDDYRFKSKGDGSGHVTYTPNLPLAGRYEVFTLYSLGTNRTTAAPHIVTHAGGQTTVHINQQVNGGVWVSLGTYNFAAGAAGSVRITDAFPDAGQVVIADAVKWAPPATGETTTALTVTPSVTTHGQAVQLRARVTASAGTPTGNVTFYNGVTELGSAALDANRYATLTTSALPVGQHSVEAVYNGSDSHSASASVTSTLNIGPSDVCLSTVSGLMAWWPGDGHTRDLVTNAPGAFGTAFTGGVRGQAFRFNGGSGEAATIPNVPSLNVNVNGSGITLAGWIRPDDATRRPLFEYGTPDTVTAQRGTWMWIGSNGALEGNIRTMAGANNIFATEPATVLPNVWQHVAMTYDRASGTARIYRNGNVVLEKSIGSGIMFRSQYPLGIGLRPSGAERYKGAMDEAMVFDRALDPEEMRALFQSTSGPCPFDNIEPTDGTEAWRYRPAIASVVSTPAVFNDRVYVVDDASVLRSLSLQTGALDRTFGTRVLDAPVRGRPVVSFAGGEPRLYLLSETGTLYARDLEDGTDRMEPIRLLEPQGTEGEAAIHTTSSPAIVEIGGEVIAFAGVNDTAAGKGYIARVNLTTREVATMVIGTSVTSSPSVTHDGRTVQIGAADADGGRLLSLQTSDFTARLALETSGSQFTAPPVVSVLDGAPYLMAGDTLGGFYCYNAANGALRWRSGEGISPALEGGVRDTAWVDYETSPNRVYVGTTAGNVYALNAATGGAAAPVASSPSSGGVSGGPLRLNRDGGLGTLYIPTQNGLYAQPSGGAMKRYPMAPGSAVHDGVRTPSAESAEPGGIVVVVTGSGAVHGLIAR